MQLYYFSYPWFKCRCMTLNLYRQETALLVDDSCFTDLFETFISFFLSTFIVTSFVILVAFGYQFLVGIGPEIFEIHHCCL